MAKDGRESLTSLALLGFGPAGWGRLLLAGCGLTLAVSAASMVVGVVLGVGLAWARLTGPRWLSGASAAYGIVIRGVPELLVIFLLYFGGPSLLVAGWSLIGLGQPGLPSPFLVGMLSIGLVSAGYQAELFRGGVATIPVGQIEAARACGFPDRLVFRRVVAPQVLRVALPALGNVWQFNLKDSALISVTGLAELMRTSLVAAGSTRHAFLFFAAASLLYLALTSFTDLCFRRLSRHLGRGERMAAR